MNDLDDRLKRIEERLQGIEKRLEIKNLPPKPSRSASGSAAEIKRTTAVSDGAMVEIELVDLHGNISWWYWLVVGL